MRLRLYQRGGLVGLLTDPVQFEDDRLRVAIGLRNEATMTGRCPVCGAIGHNRAQRRQLARRYKGKVASLPPFAHEPECPCGDDRLRELFAETGTTRA